MKTGLHPALTALLFSALVTVSHHPGAVDSAPEARGVLSPVPVLQIHWRGPLAGPAGVVRLPGVGRDEDLSMTAEPIPDTAEDRSPVAKALAGQVFQGPSYRF